MVAAVVVVLMTVVPVLVVVLVSNLQENKRGQIVFYAKCKSIHVLGPSSSIEGRRPSLPTPR